MIKNPLQFLLMLTLVAAFGCTPKPFERVNRNKTQVYETLSFDESYTPPAANDPYQLHQWQLSNGLKVFFTQNKEQANFYSQIVVRAGSTNDPADATGLAHYLEHLLFKGTSQLGTTNTKQELKYQKQVEDLYLKLFYETDPKKRAQLQQAIDQASVKAAGYVVFSEFPNLYSFLGASQTNAHTWLDETVYQVQFPKNRFEQWAKIETDRFTDPVFRLFQWELEAVYEEKNGSLDNPNRRVFQALTQNLWAGHPYGDQTTIGSIEHLKRPPLHKVKEYFQTYYVPNNMAIVLSGDLDPDELIATVKTHFGKWQAKPIEAKKLPKVPPLAKKKTAYLTGKGQDQLALAFQGPTSQSEDAVTLQVFETMLKTKLENLVLSNKVLSAEPWVPTMYYGGAIAIFASPLPDQSLDSLEQLLLQTLDEFKRGKFSDRQLQAAKLGQKVKEAVLRETNAGRADVVKDVFIKRLDWNQRAQVASQISKVTRADIMAVANKHITDKYAVAQYKNGDYAAPRVTAPKITPLAGVGAGRDEHSAYYMKVLEQAKATPPIPYKSLQTEKKVQKINLHRGVDLYLSDNPINQIGQVSVTFLLSHLQGNTSCAWIQYLTRAQTQTQTSAELNDDLNTLGLNLSDKCDKRGITVSVVGPEKNLYLGLKQYLSFITSVEGDRDLLNSVISTIVDNRKKSSTDPKTISSHVLEYVKSGKYSNENLAASNSALKAMKISDLKPFLARLSASQKDIFYVGKKPSSEIKAQLATLVAPAAEGSARPEIPSSDSKAANLKRNRALIYDVPGMAQAHVYILRSIVPYSNQHMDTYISSSIYSYYLGGGFTSPFFQEIREKRALAYSSYAGVERPFKQDDHLFFNGFVGTQVDKLPQAVGVARNLINTSNMTDGDYQVTKNSYISYLSTSRPSFRELPDRYHEMQRLGLTVDRFDSFIDYLQRTTRADLQATADSHLANKPFAYAIVGDKARMDLSFIPDDFEVIELKLDDIVAY